MGTISKNFSYAEFEHSEVAEEQGIMNIIMSADVRDNIKALVKYVLQPLRNIMGEPLHINSGYRCPELNRAVGGASTSQHTKGEAADVAWVRPITMARLAVRAKLPFDQMIIYPTFVHFSYKRGTRQRNQILYSPKYTGPKL